MEFVSGQKLTAQNLNGLVSLADGQNIPTDGLFIKSNGFNMWKPIEEKPQTIKNYRIFDVQVRYHDINDTGQEKGDNYEPEYKPFWYVYLGSDCVRNKEYNYDIWDIKIEAGSGVALIEPFKIYTQPLPLEGTPLDSFEYNNAITQMVQYEIDDTTGEVKNYKPFYAGKMLSNQPQMINSDQNGWFCTGLPAAYIDGKEIIPYELYATFIRTSSEPPRLAGNVYFSVLVFSNRPIVGLGSLKKNGQYQTLLPDGSTIHYAEIMGDHSQKIGSFRVTANPSISYGIDSTSMTPRDDLSYEEHGWTIAKPTVIDPDDTKAAQQLINYEFTNTAFIDPSGLTRTFSGNIGDGAPSLNIYFSDMNIEDRPDSFVNAYYVDFSWTDDPKDDEQNGLLEIKKLTETRGTMTEMRAMLDALVSHASAKIAIKNQQENPTTYHKLIAVFLLNTNGKISPEDGEPIPWSIEYISYVDTMPNFKNDDRYDTDLTYKKNISPGIKSIEKTTTELNIDGTTRQTYIDQIFKFNDPTYKVDPSISLSSLSAEVLIRQHTLVDGKETHQIGYINLSTILSGGEPTPTYGYTGDLDNVTSVYWDANDFKIKAIGVTMSYENGLLKTVSEAKNLGTVDTVGFELSQE